MTQQYQNNNQMIWFDDEIMTDPSQPIFDAKYWQSLDKVVGSATGRGTTWFIQLENMQAALRHYRRGGLFGKLVNDHYRFSGWDNTRCAQEFQLLLALIEAGVHVPRPIAARAVKSGLFYQADLLSERIPNARDLASTLCTGLKLLRCSSIAPYCSSAAKCALVGYPLCPANPYCG